MSREEVLFLRHEGMENLPLIVEKRVVVVICPGQMRR